MRKRILLILVALMGLPAQWAIALGLGDIEVFSALNQPLEAEIALTSVRPGETDDMIIKLAAEQAFMQVGVERPFHLTKLRFELANKPDGTPHIKVSTKDPVREPFLNFLVDVEWPRGRLVREFTLLLDPPVFSSKLQQQASQSSVPAVTTERKPLPEIAISSVGEPTAIQRQPDEPQVAETPLSESVTHASTDFDNSDFALESDEGGFIVDEIMPDAEEPLVTSGSVFEQDETGKTLENEDLLLLDSQEEGLVIDEVDDAKETESSVTQDGFFVAPADINGIPDIEVQLDGSIPYDVGKTESLLAKFAQEDQQRVTPVSRVARGDQDYQVQAGDTLSKIAGDLKPQEVSLNQAMLAILRQNPEAFLRDNINNIKKGVVLRMPDRQDMLSMDNATALEEVKRQNALWREYKAQLIGSVSAQEDIDTTQSQRTISATQSGTSSSLGLSIVAPGKDDPGSSRASGEQQGTASGTAADKSLLLAQESLEAERLEKAELQDRLKDLQQQVSMMQRLITLKDQQLAELRTRLAQAQNTDSSSTTPADLLSEVQKDTAVADTQLDISSQQEDPVIELPPQAETESTSTSEPQEEDIDAAVEPANQPDEQTATEPSLQLDSGIAEEDPLTIPEETSDAVFDNDETSEPSTASSQQTPAAQDESTDTVPPAAAKDKHFLAFLYERLPRPYDSMVEDLLQQSYGVAVVLGLPLLLLLAVAWLFVRLIKNRGTRAPKEKAIFLHEPPQDEIVDDVADDDVFSGLQDEEPALEVAEVADDFDPDRTQTIDKAVKAAARESAPAAAIPAEEEPVDDTTAEADVYLAYGLYDQAEELLKQALANHPQRNEYRGKLLETYFAQGKRAEFEALAQQLKQALGNKPSRLWDKVVAFGKEIAPDSHLFSGAADSGLKASDFAPAKPEVADIDLGGDTNTTPDVDLDFGDTDSADTDFELDLDVGGATHMQDTVITPADTQAADEEAEAIGVDMNTDLEFDLSENDDDALIADADEIEAELDLDFNADDLGLSEDDADSKAVALDLDLGKTEISGASEETVALDMDMNLDELDLGDITNTDDTDFDLDDFVTQGSGGGSSGRNAADELIAEMDASDETMPGDVVETGEDTVIDDEDDMEVSDETIIAAGLDLDETFSGDSPDFDIDEINTKLDLAREYIKMGDSDGASSALHEVIAEGSDQQRREAKSLLNQIAQ